MKELGTRYEASLEHFSEFIFNIVPTVDLVLLFGVNWFTVLP